VCDGEGQEEEEEEEEEADLMSAATREV